LTDGHYTTIDVPGSIDTQATGINNAGHIVGTHQFGDGLVHSFLLVDGNLTAIDAPGSRYTVARGINDAGVIVGEFIDGAGNHGFLLRDGHYTTIDVPNSGFTNAYGINGLGQIVGAYTDLDPGRTHGFVVTPVKEDMSPPVVTVSANPTTLWPPNGQLIAVTVSGTITDEAGGSGVQAGSAAYRVLDEYGQVQPSGSVTLGMNGRYTFTVALQASRRGNDQDGRHYTIVVSARDNAGNQDRALATVTVPHDQGR
jgi:probable HAF family extracellular repeat protein